jgi:large subunit ribosomal protein L10
MNQIKNRDVSGKLRLGRLVCQMMEEELRKSFEDVDTFFILRYSKVKATDFNILRENLRKSNSRIFVTKNVLLKRIFSDQPLTKTLTDLVSQNTAVVFVKDPLAVAKVLSEFMKENPGLEFKGGLLGERVLDLNDLKSLSVLHSIDFLKAKVISQIQLPLASLINTLKGIVNRFLIVLKAIKKEGG